MDETRLSRLKEELERARKRREEWEAKVKDLERRYREAENTCIHDMVHQANLTPEQLAQLIRMSRTMLPGTGSFILDNEVSPSGNPDGTGDSENEADILDDYEEEEDYRR